MENICFSSENSHLYKLTQQYDVYHICCVYLELLNTAQREEKIYPENKLFPIAYFFGLFKGDFSNKKIPNLTQNLLTKDQNHQMSL